MNQWFYTLFEKCSNGSQASSNFINPYPGKICPVAGVTCIIVPSENANKIKLTINKIAMYLIPSNFLYSLISISMAAVNITRRNQAATSLLEVKP